MLWLIYDKYCFHVSWLSYGHDRYNFELVVEPFKQICVFQHSVMTNFNRAYPAIQRGQGSGVLSEGSSWFTACMSEQQSSGETARMRRLAWTFAARIGDKYQIRLTRPNCPIVIFTVMRHTFQTKCMIMKLIV